MHIWSIQPRPSSPGTHFFFLFLLLIHLLFDQTHPPSAPLPPASSTWLPLPHDGTLTFKNWPTNFKQNENKTHPPQKKQKQKNSNNNNNNNQKKKKKKKEEEDWF